MIVTKVSWIRFPLGTYALEQGILPTIVALDKCMGTRQAFIPSVLLLLIGCMEANGLRAASSAYRDAKRAAYIELQLNGKVQVVIRIRTTPHQDNSPPCR